jgi:hypothetical protein
VRVGEKGGWQCSLISARVVACGAASVVTTQAMMRVVREWTQTVGELIVESRKERCVARTRERHEERQIHGEDVVREEKRWDWS